jgi:succinylarginine dihydrolase
MREYNFDGLVGLTHNYGGLSPGNMASMSHGGRASSPRQAALQGLEKMRFVRGLGVQQAVLPPHQRPRVSVLRQLGFSGSDEEIIARAGSESDHLLRLVSSAAAMWTANAATAAPSCDTADARLHLTPANLTQMFHRAIEGDGTWRILRSIFSDAKRFTVHPPLPSSGHFADEGAANHTRLSTSRASVHLFAWGRRSWGTAEGPRIHPARQTLEASQAVARAHQLAPEGALFVQQDPAGIDGGAFHTDVMAVGNGSFLMLHELAFVQVRGVVEKLRAVLGPELSVELASSEDLPLKDAVQAYPFNSQVLTLPNGDMAIVAPRDSQENTATRQFLERVVAADNPVKQVHYLDLRQSMNNGGGPACLRQRIWLTDEERAAVKANVFLTEALDAQLEAWIRKHYRDRLEPRDLGDVALAREGLTALDELTALLGLGSVYDFQLAGG